MDITDSLKNLDNSLKSLVAQLEDALVATATIAQSGYDKGFHDGVAEIDRKVDSALQNFKTDVFNKYQEVRTAENTLRTEFVNLLR